MVPDEAVDEPGFDWTSWFGREAPMIVEIGSGVGEATAVLAAARPDHNVVGLEVWTPGIADTLWRLDEAGADNVRLCGVDATWSMEHLVEPDSLAGLWIFFPDPWPKQRHHKRRLVTPSVRGRWPPPGSGPAPSGDSPPTGRHYAEQMQTVLDAEPMLEGGRVERWVERPVTRFERKGVDVGRDIVDLCYRRVDVMPAGR